jgi:hypothetical protein
MPRHGKEDPVGRQENRAEAGPRAGGRRTRGAPDRAEDPQEAQTQEGLRNRARELNRRQFAIGCFPFFWPPVRFLSGIPFRRIRNGQSARRYLVIHGNEETARAVLAEHMKTHSGIAHLVHGHTRQVLIEAWQIDPNRMFSRQGAALSFARSNWSYPPRLLDYLDRERPKLLEAILPPAGGLMIALHNNSEGYSMLDEIAASDAVSRKPHEKPRNFFLATDPADYAVLAGSPYNAVMQNRGAGSDDGSLSRLAARLKVRYVNLEVALGEREKQVEMLAWLEAHAK